MGDSAVECSNSGMQHSKRKMLTVGAERFLLWSREMIALKEKKVLYGVRHRLI